MQRGMVILVLTAFVAAISWLLLTGDNEQTVSKILPPASPALPSKSAPLKSEPLNTRLRIVGRKKVHPPDLSSNATGGEAEIWLDRLPALPPPARPQRKKGKGNITNIALPVVQSAGVMTSNDQTIHIKGVTALPLEAICGKQAKAFPCGKMARTALRGLVRGRTVHCRPGDDSMSGNITLAECKIGKTDIAQWLVAQGWATPLIEETYTAELNAAKVNKRGQWRHRE